MGPRAGQATNGDLSGGLTGALESALCLPSLRSDGAELPICSAIYRLTQRRAKLAPTDMVQRR